MQPNIVLTGFMGTGKTTVGRLLAERLGRPFVDMDAEIERRFGQSIPEIFARQGEVAFRQAEAALAAELAHRSGLVIATGGGALLAARTRRALGANSILIELQAAPEAIVERLRNSTAQRPLLAGPNPLKRLHTLYARRQATYRALPYHVDTTGRSPHEVVEAILTLLPSAAPFSPPPPEVLWVQHPGGSYPIVVGAEATADLGAWMREQGVTGAVAVISDTHVAPLHAAAVMADLMASGLEAALYEVPAGEAHKTMSTVMDLYGRLLEDGFDRTSTVLALGGGVVGDMAGFVAATYMRGVNFVQVPTSLLAMVDASVGGKVGVDHPRAKNLIGAFKQPALVVADTRFLHTLPEREVRCGLAEVVKHGIIGAPHILDWLESGQWEWPALVREAIAVKKAVVEEDPFERGRRAVLNLGHTFAHALEVVSEYTLPHGEAVAVGLVLATRLAVRLGLADSALAERVERLLRRLGLPVHYPADPEAVWQAMQGDKKKRRGRLRFVLPRAVGDVIVTGDVSEVEVKALLQTLHPERSRDRFC